MQKSGGINSAGTGKVGGVSASSIHQVSAGSNSAAQRLTILERGKDKPRVPGRKKVTEGLMDDDVGDGLQEVERWKALEPE